MTIACIKCLQIKPPESFYKRKRACKECFKAIVKKNKQEKSAYYKEQSRSLYLKRKENRPEAYQKMLLNNKLNRQRDPEKHKQYRTNWLTANKEYYKKTRQRYYQANKSSFRARDAARRAFEVKAAVKWADKELIEEFYSNCPVGYEVDHIIPLNNKNVCGLHVLGNLQYLSRKENRSKANKFALIGVTNG